jgi:signal transduction histidine kinase
MRSIRLSLVLYFLGLLAVALGAASVLAYRTAEQNLEAKNRASRQLIETQYRDRCQQEDERLNEALLVQAQTLARMVQFKAPHRVFQTAHRLSALGMLGTHGGQGTSLLAPLCWACQSPFEKEEEEGKFISWGPFRWVYWGAYRRSFKQLKLDRDVFIPLDEGVAEYYQIDTRWGASLYSPSLGKHRLGLDIKAFVPNEVLYHQFDDTTLDGSDVKLRRVILKAPIARLVPFGFGPPGRRGKGDRRNGRRDGRDRQDDRGNDGDPGKPQGRDREERPRMLRNSTPPRPSIYIQCASPLTRRNEALAVHAARRDGELAAMETESQATLVRVRNRLLLIGAITFAATVLGSFWLVRLGLLPLRRLSEAVSRVSTRDFRLPLQNKKMPTELQPIVVRLDDTLDMLKRAFDREKKATADISHELRTPLAALLATTELALRKQRSAEEYREMIEDCRLSAQEMNQAVDRLLTLARLDAGVEVVRSQKVDVAVLAGTCAAVVRPLAEARGLTLTFHDHTADEFAHAVFAASPGSQSGDGPNGQRNGVPDGGERFGRFVSSPRLPAFVHTDPDKLREVLTNLLHNAIQYNRPDGTIDLSVAREDGRVVLEVTDTGIGMSPEARDHVFERFYRADPSRGTDGLHAGLGLAIVKEYVELMGATLEVESEEGAGSTFRLVLPAA